MCGLAFLAVGIFGILLLEEFVEVVDAAVDVGQFLRVEAVLEYNW